MGRPVNNGFISSGQCAKALFHFSQGSSTLILPTTIAVISKQDIWITWLLSIPIALGFVWLFLALSDRFPTMSLVQYAEKVLGTWLGRLVALSYIFFFLILSALVLRNITDFLGMSVLPRTPSWFLCLTFMAVIVYGVCLGIETIGRTGEFLYFWGLFVLVGVALILLSQIQLENFQPILYKGLLRPIRGLYPMLGFPMAECVFLTMIFPAVRAEDRGKLKKSVCWSMVFSIIVGLFISALVLGMLGLGQMERSPYAVFDMAKSINIARLLVRIEVTVTIIWVSTVFMKLLLCVYVLSHMTAQVLRLPDHRKIVVPYATLIIPLSIVAYRDPTEVHRFTTGAWMPFSLLHGLLLPALLLIIAVVTGKRGPSLKKQPQRREESGGKRPEPPVDPRDRGTDGKEPTGGAAGDAGGAANGGGAAGGTGRETDDTGGAKSNAGGATNGGGEPAPA